MPTELFNDVKCSGLDRMRAQLQLEGVIKVAVTEELRVPPHRLAIARALGPVELVQQEQTLKDPNIPITDSPEHQRLIAEARAESELSFCWVTRVGCVAVDQNGLIIARGHSMPVIKGRMCQDLEVDIEEIKRLAAGARMDFCHSVHDVESVINQAAASRELSVRGMTWFLSLDPCQRCANALIQTEANAVFYTAGRGQRKSYYTSEGLKMLQAGQIPTYFVKMPGE